MSYELKHPGPTQSSVAEVLMLSLLKDVTHRREFIFCAAFTQYNNDYRAHLTVECGQDEMQSR